MMDDDSGDVGSELLGIIRLGNERGGSIGGGGGDINISRRKGGRPPPLYMRACAPIHTKCTCTLLLKSGCSLMGFLNSPDGHPFSSVYTNVAL